MIDVSVAGELKPAWTESRPESSDWNLEGNHTNRHHPAAGLQRGMTLQFNDT